MQVLFCLYGVILLFLKQVLYFAYVIGCKLCESTWWLQSLNTETCGEWNRSINKV